MTRRIVPAVLTVMLLWLLSLAAVAATPAAGSGCDAGLAALQAGNLRKAQAIYDAVRPQKSACVQRGLTAVSALSQARQLIAVGLDPAADAKIEQALQAEPGMAIPGDVLPETVGPPGVALAETLEHDGFHAQAVQVLLQVIENDPGIRLDAYDHEILGQAGHPWYWWLWYYLTRPLTLTAGPILAFIVLSLYARLRRRLHIQPFGASDEADAGPASAEVLRSLIRVELHRLAEESARLPNGKRLRLDHAGPYEDQFELGTVADEMPLPWKLLSGVLKNVVGSRCRLVTGTLLPETTVVLGIETVHGKVQRMGLIKHDDLGFPRNALDRLSQLALPAAAWIILTRYRGVRLGGTRQWGSFVDFAAGHAWQELGDLDQAREHYVKACNDPRNTAAAVNLAALEQLYERSSRSRSDSPSRSPSRSREGVSARTWHRRLSWLLDVTARGPRDLQWYRARYLMSEGLRDIVEADEPVPPDQPDSRETLIQTARQHAVDLAIELEENLRRPSAVPRTFLVKSQAAVLTLVARQVIPRTDQLKEMLTFGPSGPGLGGRSVLDELKSLRKTGPGKGIPEWLVEYVHTFCTLDDQAQYNLWHYHRNRGKVCIASIDRWQRALDEVTSDTHALDEIDQWRDQVLRWQDALEEMCQAELQQAGEYAKEVELTGDPVLVEQVKALPAIERPPPSLGLSHHPDYGTPRQLPPPTAPPPERPPALVERLVPGSWVQRIAEESPGAESPTVPSSLDLEAPGGLSLDRT